MAPKTSQATIQGKLVPGKFAKMMFTNQVVVAAKKLSMAVSSPWARAGSVASISARAAAGRLRAMVVACLVILFLPVPSVTAR